MDSILISIIIPVYNVADWVEATINSVVSQSYSNFEIIIVNDGSTDDSEKIVQKWIDLDSRIRLINERNSGLSAARNSGLSYARGDYILFIDGDDMLGQHSLLELAQVVENKSPDVILFPHINLYKKKSRLIKLFSGSMITWEASQWESVYRRIIGPINNEVSKVRYLDQLSTAWGKLYKRSSIKFLFRDYSENYPEDLFFNVKNLQAAKKVVYTEKAIYIYNKRNNSSVTKKFDRSHFIASNRLMKLLAASIDKSIRDEELALNNRKYLRLLSFLMAIAASDEAMKKKYDDYSFVLNEANFSFNYELAKKQIEYLNLPYRVVFKAIIQRKTMYVFLIFMFINWLRRMNFDK